MSKSLKLAATPGAWRVFMSRKAVPSFQQLAKQVLDRDNYICRYCGFQARDYQEVVNQDGNYRNNNLQNLVTACCFCVQCSFLEAVGKNDYGGGTIIYLEEITQEALNGLCHVLFCAMSNATSYKAEAESIYRSLKLRSQIVEEQLGEGMSNPATLGQAIIDSVLQKKSPTSAALLAPLRLLPSHTQFKTQIEAWAAAALNELSGAENTAV